MTDQLDTAALTVRSWCETCEVWITFENAADHPNGLGGHALLRWEIVDG